MRFILSAKSYGYFELTKQLIKISEITNKNNLSKGGILTKEP